MKTHVRHSILLVVLAFGVAVLTGCDEATISEKDAQHYVSNWAKTAQQSLENQVPVADASERFETLAKKEAKASENDTGRTHPPYDVFIRDVYSEIGWKTRLVDSDGLSERGESVWKIVSNADRQDIELGGFRFDRLRSLFEEVEKLDGRIEKIGGYQPAEGERQAARAWLQKQKVSDFELAPKNHDRLAEAIMEARPDGPLAQKMDQLEDVYIERANALAKIEHLLAGDTIRYTRKIKHFRIRHVYVHPREDDYWRLPQTDGERPDEAKGPYIAGTVWRSAAKVADRMKDEVAILHRRLQKSLRSVLTEDDPKKVLRNLEPDHPQYAGLKKAYRHYRDIVEKGGWSKVPEDPYLDTGDRDETVAKLKKRLQIEGYYPKDASIDQNYGEDLERAVEEYQKTHQMKVTGEPHDVFWSSINKTAEHRMRQIGLNLKRWRESNVRHRDPLYVLVNIPGFHTEVWKNQQRKMRFRIVVGNDASKYDKEKKKKVNPNHTPELSAYIDRVIYNPYWNVTDRIRNWEILPKVRRSLENKYKAKLRELRREKQSSAFASVGAGMGQFLVSQGSSGSSGSSNAGSESGDADSSSSSSSGFFGFGMGSSDSSSSNEAASGGENDASGGEGDESDSSPGSKGKPEVSIDDLYKMVEVEEKMKVVDDKAVFDVDKIRTLIESTRSSNSEETSVSDAFAAPGSGSDSKTKAASKGDAKEGEKKSPLEEMFPYLDPKSGVVDVSTTDPDNIPKWYEENNYEVVFPGKKWEYVREKQGNQNALGRVKVIFPNRHSVYLHDTPKKHLFERNLRAFSHGCMRMNKPLGFAEYLLKEDGSWSEIDVDSLLHEKKRVKAKNDPDKEWKRTYVYRPVFLEKQIPVHVEYFTVRVDEKGRPHFLADIYDKDQKYLEDEG